MVGEIPSGAGVKIKHLPFDLLVRWIHVREEVRLAKEEGKQSPWTDDTVVSKYRFCNVNREHDKVTIWIRKNIRGPLKGNFHALWLNCMLARFFNSIESMERVAKLPMESANPFDFQELAGRVRISQAMGVKVFGPAYIIPAGSGGSKIDHLVKNVFQDLWTRRDRLQYVEGKLTCEIMADFLMTANGMGPFMANQIVVDLKHTCVLWNASDRADFVLAGPGTKRGINRLLGKPIATAVGQKDAAKYLEWLRIKVSPSVSRCVNECFEFDINNLSNCLCEFDKYVRTLSGEGTPKQRYGS